MTDEAASQQWHDGAERALTAAKHLLASGDYEFALYTCHLAVEKALKAAFVARKHADPPRSHNLASLCEACGFSLAKNDWLDLRELGTFSSFSRYGDESWLKAEASKKNTEHWIHRTEHFLLLFGS